MTARITTAALAAQVDTLTAQVAALVGALQGASFSTPTVVAEVAQAKPAKATKAHKAPEQVVAEKAASAKAWNERKTALSPLNKALARTGQFSGEAWATRWANVDAVTQALATLTTAEQALALPYAKALVAKAQIG